MLSGYVKDSITHYPIYNATVSNPNANKKVVTDKNGFFQIHAAPDDLIYFIAIAYQYDTVRTSFLFGDTLNIYLTPMGSLLPTVTVHAQYNKYQLDSMERKNRFTQIRGNTIRSASSLNEGGFGIGINLDRVFKKKYKLQKNQDRIFKINEEWAYINYRFSPTLVAYYTGLKGDNLKKFMQLYTPSYTWLRQHLSNEEVLNYINAQLKTFKSASISQ
jgi:hypothetical protein